ncbi:CUL3 [Auxenochlorella protothecoides x Auxenochlorella symbiontica]|uniref:Cullin family profile domain-containing protein n=1 Tax=Auxenochlorella protothecoides TaxID=3075 RepID=A0A1D2A2A5_AUXPR
MSLGRGGRLKLDMFTHPVRKNLDHSYFDTNWALLENAIKEINNHNASRLSFEQLYRTAYQLVVDKFGHRLYAAVREAEAEYLRGVAERLDLLPSPSFLPGLKYEWERHMKSMGVIRAFLLYMERMYIPNQPQLAPLNQLGLDLWRDGVVRAPRIAPRARALLLEAVARDRGGELVDASLLKAITSMYMDLGPVVYRDDFETPFLEQTSLFYAAEAASLLQAADCPAYLAAAARRLEEERARAQAYLCPASAPRLLGAVERALIGDQLPALLDLPGTGLVPMLRARQYDDLHVLYRLAARVPGGPVLVQEALGAHLREAGKALVTDPERAKDPLAFVQRLLEERDVWENLVDKAFAGDRQFVYTVNRAFEAFLNLNPRSPEYISLYMDDKLRRGLKGTSEEELESALDKAILLFRFLQEKDVFERYYKQHLAKRLLQGRISSDDAERSLLVKLKTECGYQFTSKLESMFTDVKTSRDMMAEFRAHPAACAGNLELDLSVQVLTTGSWPAQNSQAVHCVLPREVEAATDAFRQFYTSAHSGRKLTWQPGMGTAEIKANFGGKRHELSCNTHQMVVLMLFNDSDRLTTREILAATQVPDAELRRVLQSLACVKGKNVLRKEPMSKEIGDADVFSVNDSFQSRLYKVKIGMVVAQRESDEGKEETRERVEEDRKPQIEAAIVRIMKARKQLSHNSIVSEVTRQLAVRFIPNQQVIKKRIESLIERDFMERDATDRTLYRYIA